MIYISFDGRRFLRKTKLTSIGIIRTAAFKPHEQSVRASRRSHQRTQGPLNELAHGMTDNPKLGLTDFHQSLSLEILDSEKTSGSDQLHRQIIIRNGMSFRCLFLTARSLSRNVSVHCMNLCRILTSSLSFASMRRDSSAFSNRCSRCNTCSMAISCNDGPISSSMKMKKTKKV